MAIFESFNGNGNYRNENAIALVTKYIFNPYKTLSGCFGGYGVNSQYPIESMINVSEQFGKRNGVQLRHCAVSVSKMTDPHDREAWYETNPSLGVILTERKIADEIGRRIAEFIGQEYQTLYAVHENCNHLHIHIVSNAVSYIDGHRFYGRRREFYALMEGIRQILWDYGITKFMYISKKEDIPSA